MSREARDGAEVTPAERYDTGTPAPTATPKANKGAKDGTFVPTEDSVKEYGAALKASEKMQKDARAELPFTKEGAEKADEKVADAAALSAVLGYTVHPDTPTKLTPNVVTPSLNNAEAKAKAYDVPVGTV